MSARWLLPALILLLPLTAPAQQSDRYGDYEIHYNAMPTGMLNQEVARSYGIPRSRGRGMLMLTVLRDGEAVDARISALARDNDDQLREVDLRRVSQEGWVSYVGSFPVEDEESLRFEVEVEPRGSDQGPFQLGFRQRFFSE